MASANLQTTSSTETRDGPRHTYTYLVVNDARSDGSAVALTQTGVPDIGDALSTDGSVLAVRKSAEMMAADEDGLHFLVSVEYERPSIDFGTSPDNPLEDRPELAITTRTLSEVVEKDVNKKAVKNSAGDIYDPPIVRPRAQRVVDIVRNEATFDSASADAFINKVNDANVTIAGIACAAHCALVEVYDATLQRRNDVTFFVVSYRIIIDHRTHKAEVLDHGYYYLKDGVRTRIKVGDPAVDAVKTQKLDKAGGILAQGADAKYNTFQIYETKDLSPLNLNINVQAPT